MTSDLLFRTDASIALPHGVGCRCALHSRRRFAAALAAGTLAVAPAWAQDKKAADEGVRRDVGKESRFTKLVPAEDIEAAASKQYAQMLQSLIAQLKKPS